MANASMQIESLKLKNFRAFHDVNFASLPRLCVLVGGVRKMV